MKKLLSVIIMACSTLMLMSQDGVKVIFEGQSPTINDFARAFFVDYSCSYTLPHIGKDIIVTEWDETGPNIDRPLKWNGHGFSY